MQFYSWVDTSAGADSTTSCSVHSSTPACTALRKQVSRRLLEQQIVTRYAAAHRIQLTSQDHRHVEIELQRLQSPQSGTQRLFSNHGVSPQFMRGVLQNQLLVRHVEAKVVGSAALSGPSFRMRKYVFAPGNQSYKSAIDLATGGVSTSGAHLPPVHWVAAYRLPSHVRSLAGLAGKGDFVGPSLQGASYVVYQILGHGVHRYGLPAREQIEARLFRSWLAKMLSTIRSK